MEQEGESLILCIRVRSLTFTKNSIFIWLYHKHKHLFEINSKAGQAVRLCFVGAGRG